MALVITNVGATAVSGVNLNPHLFFGHQTIESSSFETTQTGNIDYQNIKQLSKKQSMGIDNIVPIAESSDWADIDVADGYLTYIGDNLPSDLPLCIEQTDIDPWTVTVQSYGGYTPVDFMSTVYLRQGTPAWTWKYNEYYINVTWTVDPAYVKTCCADQQWIADFTIPTGMYPEDKICFDAENYPDVTPFSMYKWYGDPVCNEIIPGKQVQWRFDSTWSGCHEEDQYFTIISVREKIVNSHK